MAPTKTRSINIIPTRTMTTRSRPPVPIIKEVRGKRKADGSPAKETGIKRSALGEITNNNQIIKDDKKALKAPALVKKVTVSTKVLPSVKTVLKPKQDENAVPYAPNKIQTRSSLRKETVPDQTAQKPKDIIKESFLQIKIKSKRLSNEFEKTDEESLYQTALDFSVSTNSSAEKGKIHTEKGVAMVVKQMELKLNLGDHTVPEGVNDFDKENWEDVFQISHYAMDIFNYMKGRENLEKFKIGDYIGEQMNLSKWMRSLLVDWMVEVQESFELNHETLYLGVKLVDLFLSKTQVNKETLQLVGAAAMFIASKFDERIPPLVDDFLYICDGAYRRKELLRMEINILKVIDFDLGIPLSYRFLRRYARTAKVTMPILTLARYILELALMDYDAMQKRDSKLASASLYLALQMKQGGGWTRTLEFYTGYKFDEIRDEIVLLNEIMHRKPKEQLMTVRNKYAHKIFFEVAKTPLLDTCHLLTG